MITLIICGKVQLYNLISIWASPHILTLTGKQDMSAIPFSKSVYGMVTTAKHNRDFKPFDLFKMNFWIQFAGKPDTNKYYINFSSYANLWARNIRHSPTEKLQLQASSRIMNTYTILIIKLQAWESPRDGWAITNPEKTGIFLLFSSLALSFWEEITARLLNWKNLPTIWKWNGIMSSGPGYC